MATSQIFKTAPKKKHTVTAQDAVMVVLHMTEAEYIKAFSSAVAVPTPAPSPGTQGQVPPCLQCLFTLGGGIIK